MNFLLRIFLILKIYHKFLNNAVQTIQVIFILKKLFEDIKYNIILIILKFLNRRRKLKINNFGLINWRIIKNIIK